MAVRPERVHNATPLLADPVGSGAVVYWMQRERRIHDNWSFLHAQHVALERAVPLHIVFTLVPTFLGATLRQYDFMIRGLVELAQSAQQYAIPFSVLIGNPPEELLKYTHHHAPCLVVTDFEPLRIKTQWKNAVASSLQCPLHVVDAHNIVPVWHASSKQEFAAYTLRPKLNRLLPTFLEEFPEVVPHPYSGASTYGLPASMDLLQQISADTSITPVAWIKPGENAARTALANFVSRLEHYNNRNDPTQPGQSDLSPYFHFGNLSPQRAALAVKQAQQNGAPSDACASFLEELIVRRELADNFTHYNEKYDSFEGFHPWAQQTLNEHRADERDYVYTLEQWESASTHDALWNAAQTQMVRTGKMHGFMRMYWAKKILEWTLTPEEALEIAIYLNDRYELDGRDPNGYTGIAWSIGGVHDRAWFERTVYGKIRYMNASGCARKFNVKEYIRTHASQTLL